MFWKNLRVNRKIAVIIGVQLCIILSMSGMFMFNLHNLGRETRAIAFAADLNAILLARITDHWRWFASLQRYVFDDSITTLEVQEDMRQCGFGKWYYGPQRAAAEAFSPAIAEPLRLIEEEHSALHVSASEIKQHQMEGNAAESQIIFEKISMQNVLTIQKLLNQISTIMDKDIKESARKFDSQVVETFTITAGIVIFASLLALFMGAIITRNITEPVLRIARYVQSVSEGRLDATLIMMGRDELGELADNLKRMVANLASVIRKNKAQARQTREAEERGRILLDASPVGAVLWDENGNILDCNQAFVRMFGIADKDEFIHRFAEMMPEFQPDGAASGDAWAANLRATFATGYQKFEWMHLTASGETLPTEKTQFRIPWKGGWCVASYTYDLRERMARREAEEQARVFLDAIPQGAVLFDMEHNIIDCNQTALRMFGLADRAEYMARYHELDPEFQPDGAPSREKAAAFIRAAFETGSQEYEWMHCTSSGDPLPTEMYLIRIPWKGAWCVAACIRDLRDRMALREAEERAQSLEVISKAAEMASHAKSEFLAKMSHELRTPLNAVIGFLGLELQKRLPRETAANLEISLDACHNLLYLIDDILDISKIETDHFDLTRDNYRLVGFIDDIVRLNRFRLESKHIHCRLDIDENLPSWLYGDDLRIKQVINNLLSNAFKYTEQGTITLGIGLAPEEETQAGSVSIRFSVRDTGQGIAAGNIEKLFTSYTRFDNKTNRLIEGTGLGLAICKGLVEKMGGRMEVDSEYGKGSVFSCVIPQLVIDPTPIGKVAVRELTFPRSTSRRGETTRRPPWRCSPMPYARVLVVDDVPTNLAVARSMLLRYGMTVDCVAGGREAIERIRSGQPRYDAVFMDHMMPGMDGIEALRWIRGVNSDYARSVPVIILTANVVAGNEKKFLDLGFQAFLAKPIDPMKLDGVLNRWVKDALREAGLTAVHTEQAEQDAAPCGDQDVGASLIHIDGLDMEEAISRFGSEEAYLDVLRSYAVNTPQLLEQMRRLSDTDLSDCALLAHGMKGASYGVGAKALGDMAEKLERWGTRKHGRKVRQALPLFFEAAEKLLHDIGALLAALGPDSGAEEDKPLKAAPDPGELAALYKASLSCSHSAMEERLRTLEQYRYQADGELVAWLRARVDALDYDRINERLAKYVS